MTIGQNLDDVHFLDRAQAGPCIINLLQEIPDAWAEFDIDRLSDIESKTLYWLVAAGLVERRCRIWIRRAGDANSYIKATIEATGEYGYGMAMEPVTAEYVSRWGHSPCVCEHSAVELWRLTNFGCQARDDIRGGLSKITIDFVLKQGGNAGRDPAHGTGRMLRLEYRDGIEANQEKASETRILNWEEGAELIAAAFATQGLKIPPATDVADDDDTSTLDERAAAAKVMHPEWTDEEIAGSLGCNRTSLHKPHMKKYKAAKGALKAGREEFRQDGQLDRRRRPSNLNRREDEDSV